MPSGYVPDPGFEKAMALSLVDDLEIVARGVAVTAKDLMPEGSDPRLGHIRDEFIVVKQLGEVSLGNSNPFMHLAEFGSVNNPAYSPMRRAVRAHGYRLSDI